MLPNLKAASEVQKVLTIFNQFGLLSYYVVRHIKFSYKSLKKEIVMVSYDIIRAGKTTDLDSIKQYIDLGVTDFSIGTDISVLYNYRREEGDEFRKLFSDLGKY